MTARALVGTPKTSGKTLSEVIIREWDESLNRSSIKLAAGTYLIGQVIGAATKGDSSLGTEPAFTDAICLENITVPAGQNWDVAALVRGPALCNFDGIVRNPSNETDAALVTRLANLVAQGIVFYREPTFKEQPSFTS